LQRGTVVRCFLGSVARKEHDEFSDEDDKIVEEEDFCMNKATLLAELTILPIHEMARENPYKL